MPTEKNGLCLFLDNEGPCTLNDNAQEITVALVQKIGLGESQGVNFYHNLSTIDDIWGDFKRIPQDPTYSSGHTLKVILPFLKAMGANEEWLMGFARDNLRVVPSIKSVIADLNRDFDLWQISTSYEYFVRAFCDAVEFNFAKTRCTVVKGFDQIPVSEREKGELLAFMLQVANMSTIEYNKNTGEVKPEHQANYDFITHMIWEVVAKMPAGQLLETVYPVGQAQKREAMVTILNDSRTSMNRAMYVGDSQTDVQCIEYLRDHGLTMMFNGKGRAFELSHIAYIGEDARAIREVARRFAEFGRDGVINFYSSPREAECGGLIASVTPENVDELHNLSVKKRKEFRGVNIGLLT